MLVLVARGIPRLRHRFERLRRRKQIVPRPIRVEQGFDFAVGVRLVVFLDEIHIYVGAPHVDIDGQAVRFLTVNHLLHSGAVKNGRIHLIPFNQLGYGVQIVGNDVRCRIEAVPQHQVGLLALRAGGLERLFQIVLTLELDLEPIRLCLVVGVHKRLQIAQVLP